MYSMMLARSYMILIAIDYRTTRFYRPPFAYTYTWYHYTTNRLNFQVLSKNESKKSGSAVLLNFFVSKNKAEPLLFL